MTQGNSDYQKAWFRIVNKRLEREVLLLKPKLQILDVEVEPTKVTLKWDHTTAAGEPLAPEMEHIVDALGRETAWSAALLVLGHDKVFVERISFFSSRKVPDGVTLFSTAGAKANRLSPEDPPIMVCADIVGTIYTLRGDGDSTVVAEFEARVSHA
jgi:hypothetical protein